MKTFTAPKGYDLIRRRETKHVEVKGITTDGSEVIPTPNGSGTPGEYLCTALFVLSNITIERADNGTVSAAGGDRNLFDP